MEFDVKRFSLSFYISGPSKFVVKVDSKITSCFFRGNHVIIESRGGRPGRKEKVVCADFLGFILILHRLNQFWNSLRCVWSASEALLDRRLLKLDFFIFFLDSINLKVWKLNIWYKFELFKIIWKCSRFW